MIYKNFVIEKSSGPLGSFDYWPEDGVDCELTENGWKSNVHNASSIEDAKDAIDEKIMESLPYHGVELNGRVYEFPWIQDAVKFASLFNAEMVIPICNP